jgi:F-type H+-transporting ATPase subunit b
MFEDARFWAFLSFLIFVGFMIYLKVPGVITGFLDRRAEGIRTELDQARKLREEAQALLADYQRKARQAESEAEEIVDQARREAEALSVEGKRRVEEYVASRTRLAEQKIAQAEAQAVQEVRALSADVAVAAAEKILAARVKGKEGEALVARAIDDVKAKLH